MSDLKPFYAVLKKHGFKRVHRGRSENDCHVYEKELDDRVLELQLWPDGRHRVSHWHAHITDAKRACMNTTPSPFTTVEKMQDAILHESSRRDGIFRSKCIADVQRRPA